MELRQLRYFRAVVEAGSFSAAALTLHMSQPPLSAAVAKLEAELGVTLLERTGRGVRVTSAGAYLLDAASHLLAEADRVAERLTRFGDGTVGSLAIAAAPMLMWRRIPDLLRAHADHLAEIDLRLVEATPWEALDHVLTRRVDVAFMVIADRERLADRYRDALWMVPWGELPLVATFGRDATDLPDPVPLAELRKRTLVLPKRTLALPSLPDVVLDLLRRHDVRPREHITVENVPTLLPLVEAGLAATVLPADLRALDSSRYVIRDILEPPPSLSIVAIVRAKEDPSPTLANVLERIRHV